MNIKRGFELVEMVKMFIEEKGDEDRRLLLKAINGLFPQEKVLLGLIAGITLSPTDAAEFLSLVR